MKHYTKPIATVAKYAFNEHIVASGSITCTWTTEYEGNTLEQINDVSGGCHRHSEGNGQYEHLALS